MSDSRRDGVEDEGFENSQVYKGDLSAGGSEPLFRPQSPLEPHEYYPQRRAAEGPLQSVDDQNAISCDNSPGILFVPDNPTLDPITPHAHQNFGHGSPEIDTTAGGAVHAAQNTAALNSHDTSGIYDNNAASTSERPSTIWPSGEPPSQSPYRPRSSQSGLDGTTLQGSEIQVNEEKPGSTMETIFDIWLQTIGTPTSLAIEIYATSWKLDLATAMAWARKRGFPLEPEDQRFQSDIRISPSTPTAPENMKDADINIATHKERERIKEAIKRVELRSCDPTGKPINVNGVLKCVRKGCNASFDLKKKGDWKKHITGICSDKYWFWPEAKCCTVYRQQHKLKGHLSDRHGYKDKDMVDEDWEELFSLARLEMETEFWVCRFSNCNCCGKFKDHNEWLEHLAQNFQNGRTKEEWGEGRYCSKRKIRRSQERRSKDDCKDDSFFDIDSSDQDDSDNDDAPGSGSRSASKDNAGHDRKRRRVENNSEKKGSHTSGASGRTRSQTKGSNRVATRSSNHLSGESTLKDLCYAPRRMDIDLLYIGSWVNENDLALYTGNAAFLDDLESLSKASNNAWSAEYTEVDDKTALVIAEKLKQPNQDSNQDLTMLANIDHSRDGHTDSWSSPYVNSVNLSLAFSSSKQLLNLFKRHSRNAILDESGMFPIPKAVFKKIFSVPQGFQSEKPNPKMTNFIADLTRRMCVPSSSNNLKSDAALSNDRLEALGKLYADRGIGLRVVGERWLCSVMMLRCFYQ